MASHTERAPCDHEEVIALVGPSQAGKSTFTRRMMLPRQGEGPAVGDGSGESMTTEATLVMTKVGPMVDGRGSNDSRLYPEGENQAQYAAAIAQTGARKAKFLVFDSAQDGTTQLRATLVWLEATFGPEAKNAAVVVLSKADAAKPLALQKREQLVRQIMGPHQMSELVVLQGEGLRKASSCQP